jgi:DNA-binding response OmpR family regulator
MEAVDLRASHPSARPDAPRTVLLADGDELLRDELAHALRQQGYRVVELDDGFEVDDYLDATEEEGGVLPTPDIIVAACRMDGRSGLELLVRVRASTAGIPFVLLFAPDDVAIAQQARRMGATDLLFKPLRPEELAEAIGALT